MHWAGEGDCRKGSEAVGPRADEKVRQWLNWSSLAARRGKQTAVVRAQMKVVTARATSVTGCEQSFDEELDSRLAAMQSRRRAKA